MQLEVALMQITSFQFLFLSLFLFFNSKVSWQFRLLLGAFFLLKGLIMSFNTLTGGSYTIADWLNTFILLSYFPFLFSYMPCVFLYISLATRNQKELVRKDLWHASPFIVLVSLSGISSLTGNSSLMSYSSIIVAIYYLTALGYLFAMAMLIKPLYSGEQQLTPVNRPLLRKWLSLLVVTLTAIMLIFFSSFVVSQWLAQPGSTVVSYLLSLGLALLFIFANGVLFFMLKEPTLLSTQTNSNKAERVLKLPKEVTRQSGDKLIFMMNDELLYLDPLLCLNDIAIKLKMHPRTTSMVLKCIIKQNFNDFVNTFRVNEAKNKIKHYGIQKTLTEIQLESGFNSKSVFNSVFKKQTGVTPTQYRNSKMLNVVSKKANN